MCPGLRREQNGKEQGGGSPAAWMDGNLIAASGRKAYGDVILRSLFWRVHGRNDKPWVYLHVVQGETRGSALTCLGSQSEKTERD